MPATPPIMIPSFSNVNSSSLSLLSEPLYAVAPCSALQKTVAAVIFANRPRLAVFIGEVEVKDVSWIGVALIFMDLALISVKVYIQNNLDAIED